MMTDLPRELSASIWLAAALVLGIAAPMPRSALAQRTDELTMTPEAERKVDGLVDSILDPEATIEVDPRKSRLIRLKQRVTRFSITNPEIAQINQFNPLEYELIGGQVGRTTMTLWFEDGQILRYVVRVRPDAEEDIDYGDLQDRINELFPNSVVQLIPFADKLIVRGQARDSEEAAQILSILGGNQVDQQNNLLGPGSFVNLGTAVRPNSVADDLPANNIISLLDVPGEQQVMLKVRIAEVTRAAARDASMNLVLAGGEFNLTSLFAGQGGSPFQAILSTQDMLLTLQALSSNGYSKILAEPNLVTLNGQPANFISGGQFAVPTVVGVGGVGAVSTGFQGFGTQLSFTPTIIDKDRIRLFVAPSVSSVNGANSVGGIPGLNTRAASTTVDLREGQWLAIAGLIQDEQRGGKVRAPYLGDIPVFGNLFNSRTIARDETELVILVSPEIVHPMETKEVPLVLPGMDVTEPTDAGFYFWGRYEGRPDRDHRSTVWPIQRDWFATARYHAAKAAKLRQGWLASETTYVLGPSGFSE